MDANRVGTMLTALFESHEFKNLLYLKTLEHFGPELKALESAETIVETPPSNLTPADLAWHFVQKLRRRPYSTEDLVSLIGHMEDLVSKGVPAGKILEVLNKRGKSTEAMWEFKKRFDSLVQKEKPIQTMLERAEETRRMIEERDCVRVSPRRLS